MISSSSPTVREGVNSTCKLDVRCSPSDLMSSLTVGLLPRLPRESRTNFPAPLHHSPQPTHSDADSSRLTLPVPAFVSLPTAPRLRKHSPNFDPARGCWLLRTSVSLSQRPV